MMEYNKPKMVSSRLNQRITLEKPVYSNDSLAGHQITWEQTETCWAEVKNVFSRQINSTSSIKDNNVYEITIRKYHNVRSDMRIIYKSRIIKIDSIANIYEHPGLLKIIATEEVL